MQNNVSNNRLNLRFLAKCILFVFLFLLTDFGVSQFLTSGLYKYYGLLEPAEILLVGHSHTMLGLDEYSMEAQLKCNVAKYAIEGANAKDRLAMIRHFLHKNGDSVKLITYDVDPLFLTGLGIAVKSYSLFYPFLGDSYIEEYIKNEEQNKSEFFINKWFRTTRFNDLNLNGSLRGHLGFYSNIKIGSVDTAILKKRISNNDFVKISFDNDLKSAFEETLEFVSSQNIKMALLLLPTIDILNDVEYEKYQKAINLLEEYDNKYENIFLFNYNEDLSHEYDLFYDSVHLNSKGKKIVTDRVVSDIKKIL